MAGEAESAAPEDQGVQQERGDADRFSGTGLLATMGQTQYLYSLTIPGDSCCVALPTCRPNGRCWPQPSTYAPSGRYGAPDPASSLNYPTTWSLVPFSDRYRGPESNPHPSPIPYSLSASARMVGRILVETLRYSTPLRQAQHLRWPPLHHHLCGLPVAQNDASTLRFARVAFRIKWLRQSYPVGLMPSVPRGSVLYVRA